MYTNVTFYVNDTNFFVFHEIDQMAHCLAVRHLIYNWPGSTHLWHLQTMVVNSDQDTFAFWFTIFVCNKTSTSSITAGIGKTMVPNLKKALNDKQFCNCILSIYNLVAINIIQTCKCKIIKPYIKYWYYIFRKCIVCSS